MKANLSGRVSAVTIPLPVDVRVARWARGRETSHGWTMRPVPVALYAGDGPATAAEFGAAILASFRAHRAAWLGRMAPDGTFAPVEQYAASGTAPAYQRPARVRAPRVKRERTLREYRAAMAADESASFYVDAPADPAPEPVRSATPATTRPTCETCGRTFRKSGVGYAWHLANVHKGTVAA